jgi:hypothetical protein
VRLLADPADYRLLLPPRRILGRVRTLHDEGRGQGLNMHGIRQHIVFGLRLARRTNALYWEFADCAFKDLVGRVDPMIALRTE